MRKYLDILEIRGKIEKINLVDWIVPQWNTEDDTGWQYRYGQNDC